MWRRPLTMTAAAALVLVACTSEDAPQPPVSAGGGGGSDGRVCGSERCDGLDNDCDGAVDEDCPCDPGSEQRCYSGDPITASIGVCAQGTQSCESGRWGDCVGEVLSSVESCGDGFDQDCNGAVDDGCSCTTGQTQPCYPGNPIQVDVGRCGRGTQSCDGTRWGQCTGAVAPADEQCNEADDDCDGITDEGCGSGGSGGGGGGGGAPIVSCAVGPVLTDDFEAPTLANHWSAYGSGSVTIDGGELLVESDTALDSSGVVTVGTFDMTGCTATFAVPAAQPEASVGRSELLLWVDDAHYLGFVFESGELNARVAATVQLVDSVPYTPGSPIWLRVRQAGQNVIFESSPDGTQWSAGLTTNNGGFLTAVRVNLRARNTAPTTTASMLRVDNLSLAP